MADNNINEIIIAERDQGECSDATVEIKVKTLDSQTYTLRVDKCMPVPALKEQIATVTGVLSDQQRLICRGKVLKDDQLLSAYHVEDGHTLHLVVRQPLQHPPSFMAGIAGDGHAEPQGADPIAGDTRNRSGQVSHSVVLGTFNIPDQGDGGIPDLNRIVSAVLNSVGIGSLVPVSASIGNGSSTMAQGTGLQGQERVVNDSSRSDTNQPQADHISDVQVDPGHVSFRFPAGPLLRPFQQATVIPDSLTTLSHYLNRMRNEFALNSFDNQSQTSTFESNEAEGFRSTGLPSVAGGLPTPAVLGAVIRSTQQLLIQQAGASLDQLATQLEGEATVTDASARREIQSAAMRNGIMMQNLGALLLELGRTTMTLRMGESSAEAVVNAGPAVFVSTSGPNPLMVQPLPFVPGSSFGAIPVGSTHQGTRMTAGSVTPGDVLRNIDIHIRSGSSSAPSGNAEQGEHGSVQQTEGQASSAFGRQGVSSILGETSAVRVVPVRTVVAAVPAAISARPPTESTGGALGVFYPLLARFQQLNPSQITQIRSLPHTVISGDNPRGAETAQQQTPGSVSLLTTQPQVQVQASVPTASQSGASQEELRLANFSASTATTSADETQPLVHGMPQRQAGLSAEQDLGQGPANVRGFIIDVEAHNMQEGHPQGNVGTVSGEESSSTQLPNGLGQLFTGMVSGGQTNNGRRETVDFISQLLHYPARSSISRQSAGQSETVAPAGISSMIEQAMQNPFSRGSQLQMMEQIGERSRNLAEMFSGLNRNQTVDFSGLLHQMMPAVSQVLGNESEAPASQNGAEEQPRTSSSGSQAYNHGGETQPRISNEEQHSAEVKEVEVQKPQDEADNVNGNENLPSDADIQQAENSDDVYPGVSPPSKRQKTQ
jgi:uncharacterized ubiquitin-like protein YukD